LRVLANVGVEVNMTQLKKRFKVTKVNFKEL